MKQLRYYLSVWPDLGTGAGIVLAPKGGLYIPMESWAEAHLQLLHIQYIVHISNADKAHNTCA